MRPELKQLGAAGLTSALILGGLALSSGEARTEAAGERRLPLAGVSTPRCCAGALRLRGELTVFEGGEPVGFEHTGGVTWAGRDGICYLSDLVQLYGPGADSLRFMEAVFGGERYDLGGQSPVRPPPAAAAAPAPSPPTRTGRGGGDRGPPGGGGGGVVGKPRSPSGTVPCRLASR